MNRFFKENIAGVLALSALGSLIATAIAHVLSSPTAGGTMDWVSRPIPVWMLFPYSIVLVLSFAAWAVRSRRDDRAQIAQIRGERDATRQHLQTMSVERDMLQQQLAAKRSTTVSPADLMRFVAVVLTSAKRSVSNPITHEFVCKHVAGLAGEGVPCTLRTTTLGASSDVPRHARDGSAALRSRLAIEKLIRPLDRLNAVAA